MIFGFLGKSLKNPKFRTGGFFDVYRTITEMGLEILETGKFDH